LVVAEATRRPKALVTVTEASVTSPAVVIWFAAKRVFPSTPLRRFTRASSAWEKERTRSARSRISARERIWFIEL
jgi:hypothetical protein